MVSARDRVWRLWSAVSGVADQRIDAYPGVKLFLAKSPAQPVFQRPLGTIFAMAEQTPVVQDRLPAFGSAGLHGRISGCKKETPAGIPSGQSVPRGRLLY